MIADDQMKYPGDFPPESRAAVTAEKMRAGKDFDGARKNLPLTQYGAGQDLEAELRKYILRQFSVFGREACKLGHKGIWQVDRVEEEALEFLRLSTIDAQYSTAYDKSGRPFGQNWISNWGGAIEPEVQRQFEGSGDWQQFKDALLQVAEAQAAPPLNVGKNAMEEIGQLTRDPEESEQTTDTLANAEGAIVGAPELSFAIRGDETDRADLVNEFLRRCNKDSDIDFRVIRKHIWLAAGHARARQFQYWQEKSNKATEVDDRNFRRILRMSPAEFFALLRKMGFYPPSS